MFKRKIYDKLLKWKNNSNGKTALLIEGARRVGKSTIVEEFAKNEYKNYILIDFAYASKNIKDLFEDLTDLDYLFLQLQLQYGVDLENRKSLIIFDEVQFCPKARQAIKLLVADGRYDYIEMGSLISIKKNIKDILIPSEEEKINMYPMDFEEFLWATNDEDLVKILRKCYKSKIKLGDKQNQNIMRKYRLYMIVGGMPQAVKEYIDTNNLRKVDEVKRNIINLYMEDFYKIDVTGKISALYSSIPSQLSRHSSRYQVSTVLENHRASSIEEELQEMIASKTVLISYNVNDPNIGFALSKDINKYKLFLSDIGLFITMMFIDREFTDNIIYQKFLSNKLSTNMGMIYENAVAIALNSAGYELYYNSKYDNIAKRNYEVDFLISIGNKICPIEVKSSNYKVHKSLDKFIEKYSDRIKNKYVIYTKDYTKENDIEYLPIYYTQFLAEDGRIN